RCLESLGRVDEVLGLVDEAQLPVPAESLPPEAARLVREREEARKAKDFQRADELRGEIGRAGRRVEDTPQGPRIFPA
ncbi:MAG: CysS/YqeB C-terminal domain-containing protein, partial [Desulfovibrionaceae bacterium]